MFTVREPKTEARFRGFVRMETGDLTSTESSKAAKTGPPKIVPFELRMHRNDAVIATLTNFAYAFFQTGALWFFPSSASPKKEATRLSQHEIVQAPGDRTRGATTYGTTP